MLPQVCGHWLPEWATAGPGNGFRLSKKNIPDVNDKGTAASVKKPGPASGSLARPAVSIRTIGENEEGQRIDNYLIKILKGVPKSRIYKAIRSGEVRVNRGRVQVSRRLAPGDQVRIPPIRVSSGPGNVVIPPRLLDQVPILLEDEHLLIVNKPSGLAVHGGSGLPFGLIEAFRQFDEFSGYLELVHRLDRETSGCLMIARSRPALLGLQRQLNTLRTAKKIYLALVRGQWQSGTRTVDLGIGKGMGPGNEKRSVIDNAGKQAVSIISPVQRFQSSTLVEIELKTGRMHQARVHCTACGHPIAGDRLYGDSKFNDEMRKLGLGRLFLHAAKLGISHPQSKHRIEVSAPLPDQLQVLLDSLAGFESR
jgi:23S rRNA pseudouridine955/2504/2580 synthase